jgi:hypothetical protein
MNIGIVLAILFLLARIAGPVMKRRASNAHDSSRNVDAPANSMNTRPGVPPRLPASTSPNIGTNNSPIKTTKSRIELDPRGPFL